MCTRSLQQDIGLGPIFNWERLYKVVTSLIFLFGISISATLAQVATRYGAEPSGPNYYCTDAPYVDLMQLTTSWWQMPNHNVPPSLTSNGYPAADGSYQCFLNLTGYPSGYYQFYGEGKYSVSVSSNIDSYSAWPNRGFVPGSLQTTVVNGVTITTGLVPLNFPAVHLGTYNSGNGAPGILINMNNVDPNDPPNNFHLIRPDYPAWPSTNAVFGKEYLQALMPFSCLRFIDWMWTEDAKAQVTTWESRPSDTNFADGRRARSYEKMIALCNQLNCDMWINVPLYATADWDVGMATLVKQNLNPNLHCYYEVGNELWNWGGPAFHPYWQQIEDWDQADASVQALHQAPYKLGAWALHGAEMGHQLMNHLSNMQPILGATGRPMLCGQVVVQDYCKGGLIWINANYGPPANYIWGIAGAPYVGESSADPAPGSVPEIFQSMTDYLNSTINTALKQHAALAQQYGIHFCSYESGQGLGSSQAVFDLNQQAQYDAGMANIYYALAAMEQSYGMELCNFYDFCRPDSQYGYWGALQDIRQILSSPWPPKFAAEVNISMPSRGLPTGGGGGGGGSTGGGNGDGHHSHTFMPPHHGMMPGRQKGIMPGKIKQPWPSKFKSFPINGHPSRGS